jgi:hypothetical protein
MRRAPRSRRSDASGRSLASAGVLAALGALVGWPAPLGAQTKYPYIDAVFPMAVSRGGATVLEVQASGSLKTAYKALVDGEGVRAAIEKPAGDQKVPDGTARVRVEVDPAAAVGTREIRLVTEEAITTAARFYVTDLPAVAEKTQSASLKEALEVAPPCAVNGRVGGSVEVDWYRFQAKQGERINLNLLGARLHVTLHHVGRFTPHFDGFMAVTDAEGRELASADDWFFADPFLSFTAPADGTYHVAVREANYKGHASYTYSLLVTRGPCATGVLPLALKPDATAEVELIGPGYGPGEKAALALPAGAAAGRIHVVRPRRPDGTEAGEVWVAAREVASRPEAEGTAGRENDRPEAAEAIALPAGVAGRLGAADDLDHFAFTAAKGAAYVFEAVARRVFSPPDIELAVLDENGAQVASADDGRDLAGRSTKDPRLAWTAPADGRFIIRVRDLHQRGGPDFAYHLEAALAEPDFELTLDPELSMIGPGNRSPIYVRAHRRNGFAGEVALAVEGLPAGVTASVPPILAGTTDACVVLAAAADAPRDGALFRVRGKATVKRGGADVEIVREAVPLCEIYQAQRVEGRTAGVAITAPSDIEVTTEVRELVLKPGESKEIPIRIVRGEKYKSGSVTLWAMWRYEGAIFGNSLPPGVKVDEGKSATSLNGEATEGKITLAAAPDAKPIARVQMAVIGLVPIEFSVFVPYATPPILVTVADPKALAAGQ